MERAEGNYGITRRIGLSVMGRTKEQLVESFGEDEESGDLLLRTLEQVGAYIDHLKDVDGLMRAVQARLFVVASTLVERDKTAA